MARHGIEEMLQAGMGADVGLEPGHYEMRGGVGWRHHMTLFRRLALWFLILEKGIGSEGKSQPLRSYYRCRRCSHGCSNRSRPSVHRIAEKVSRVLRRNEETRIYHWYAATGEFPPRRGQPDG